jgi:phage terminase small subunit
MAGVKGKSGGPRKNAGGARPGAGRKPKAGPAAKSANAKAKPSGGVKVELEPQPRGGALKRSKAEPVPIEDCDMLKLLQDVALGRVDASTIQVRAAIAAVQYTHTKRGDGGKKEEQADKAKTAGKGKFAPSAPPKLVVNNR